MKRQSSSSQAGDVEQNPLTAIFLMTSAMLLLPVMDITAKYLSAELPPIEVTFGRFFFQSALALHWSLAVSCT